ncbi:MAG: YjbQ family protein [SAR202 cluster bacterium]|nr:YjbQ family protein [SAR202 cluster bacterium]
MKSHVTKLKFLTKDAPDFIDITAQVKAFLAETGVQDGMIVVFSRHTTAAVVINENEPLLLQDMRQRLEAFAPRNAYYKHNDLSIRTVNLTENEPPNGHAHCQHLLLGSSQTIPVVEGCASLGQWQSIFFLELDSPRPREVVVQVFGE